jgi:hypothetical protein
MRVDAAGTKADRVAVLLPHAIQQRDKPVIELVENRFERFVPFRTQHDVVDHVRGHRCIHTVETHERRAHGRRRVRSVREAPLVELD